VNWFPTAGYEQAPERRIFENEKNAELWMPIMKK